MWKHAQFQRVFLWRHIKHVVPYCPRRDTWTARGLHVIMFFPGSATSWVFFRWFPCWRGVPRGPIGKWRGMQIFWRVIHCCWRGARITWRCVVYGDVVCDMYMSHGTSGRTCIWHVGHLARHVCVMWDILRNENCNEIQFLGDPLFCTTSSVTVGCFVWYHIWHYKLLGCVVHFNTLLTSSCLAISTTRCQMHVTYAIYRNKHERQVFHQTLETDTKNAWNKCRPMLSKSVNATYSLIQHIATIRLRLYSSTQVIPKTLTLFMIKASMSIATRLLLHA